MQSVVDRLRWLLLTHQGRVVLAVIYSVLSVVSIVVYTIRYSIIYGLGQLVVTGFGLLWARWCIQRPGPEYH
jgi:hypothetical protein